MGIVQSKSNLSKAKPRERGNSILEFGIVAPFMVLSLLGVVSIGLTLGRALQVNQVVRDTGHMFFDGVDFSVTSNQNIVGRLAYGMGLASDALGTITTSGNGIVILSQVIEVGATECTMAGLAANTSACPNFGSLVIEKRIVIGNSGLRTSAFGTPTSTLLQSDGSILPSDYCTNASVVVPTTSAAASLSLAADQYSFIVEDYFVTPSLSGFIGDSAYAYVMM
jgi:hypothetical protein